ncbi:exodeoxyribonuclease V subunit beta [Anaerovibrio sp. RM50]|uniref:UvrD-helicase domain-containing protein n=1 Tax=Anaerovibrio sp. RM50 TaxID=1200557 RepID=UPI00047F06F5|nr:UvrD-helicase domain-containing protein [Anaerovibrio sp. RM50]
MNKENTSLTADKKARKDIVSCIDKNLFVEAGAGSGKTTMLVDRMTAMVEGGIPIEKIAAITFTKAAAREFYNRFQKKLREASEAGSERCRDALRNIDLCFMGTIDSLCQQLLSEHPAEAGIPSGTRLITDEEAKEYYDYIFVQICNGKYGDKLARQATLIDNLITGFKPAFHLGLDVIMDNRNVDFQYKKIADASIDDTYAREIAAIRRFVHFLADNRDNQHTDRKESRSAWESFDEQLKVIDGKWEGNLPSVENALSELEKIHLVRSVYDDADDDIREKLGTDSTQTKQWTTIKKGVLCGILKEYKHDLLMDFLVKSAHIMETFMQERGLLTFFDGLYYLRNMLRADAKKEGKLIRYIYSRHSYFLVDEFQDTNPLQSEILFYLTAEEPVAKWDECTPRAGSLFIVGDPKQSIYRFRGADVSAFQRVKGLFEAHGGILLQLTRNFRSNKALCERFNNVFEHTLQEKKGIQSGFAAIPLPDPVEDDDCLRGFYTYEAEEDQSKGKGKNNDKDKDKGNNSVSDVVKIILKLVNNDQYKIFSREDKQIRKIDFSDIMVITNKKENIEPIMESCSRFNIPTRVEGKVPFNSTAGLKAIADIYEAVLSPDNSLAVYRALTGDIIGCTSEMVQRFLQGGGSLKSGKCTEPVSNEEMEYVQNSVEWLKETGKKAASMSPAALYSYIMEEYRIFRYVEPNNLEVVYYTLELLRHKEADGSIISQQDGLVYLKDLMTKKNTEERCLSFGETNCVHIANLHKVKGLQAPIVILDAAKATNREPTYSIIHNPVDDNGNKGYIFTLQHPHFTNTIYSKTSRYAAQSFHEMEIRQAEQDRLIYVAATRAENALIVGCSDEKKLWKPLISEDNNPDAIDDNIPVFPLEEATESAVNVKKETAEAKILYDENSDNAITANRAKETNNYVEKLPSKEKLILKHRMEQRDDVVELAEGESEALEETSESEDGKVPADVRGTMIHKLMEMLVSSGGRISPETAARDICQQLLPAELQDHAEKMEAELIALGQRMLNGGVPQDNGVPQDIFNTMLSAQEVYCEVPFQFREDTAEGPVMWSGVMDAIYKTNGQYHIIEYKTGEETTGLDEKYQGQLAAYIKAFKATTGQEADAHTYHIRA